MKVLWKRAATIFLSLAVLLSFTPFLGQWTDGAVGAEEVYAEEPTVLSEININFDPGKLCPDSSWTIGEMHWAVKNFFGTDTEGFRKRNEGTGYYYNTSEERWSMLSVQGADAGTHLTAGTEYMARFYLECQSGEYTLPDSVKALEINELTPITAVDDFSVFVNGIERSDVFISCNATYGHGVLFVYVPLGVATDNTFTPYLDSLDVFPDEITLGLNDTKTFVASMMGMGVSALTVNWDVSGKREMCI